MVWISAKVKPLICLYSKRLSIGKLYNFKQKIFQFPESFAPVAQ